MPNETAPNELGEVAVGASDNPYPDRVEDVEKAHEMALAGNNERSQAAEDRVQAIKDAASASFYEDHSANFSAQGNEGSAGLYSRASERYAKKAQSHTESAKEHDSNAELAETEAGERYDNPFPDREQNIEKAEVMANAGDPLRTEAVRLRGVANDEEYEWTDRSRRVLENDARNKDEGAAVREEEAGRQYEEEILLQPEKIGQQERDRLAKEAADWLNGERRERYDHELKKAIGMIEAIRQKLVEPLGALVYSERQPRISGVELDDELQSKLYPDMDCRLPLRRLRLVRLEQFHLA